MTLFLRYRRILARVVRAPDARNYMDAALQPTTTGEADRLVEAYADIIPQTYGAPPREAKLSA